MLNQNSPERAKPCTSMSVPALRQRVSRMLDSLPQVRGQEGNINVGNDLSRLLNLTEQLRGHTKPVIQIGLISGHQAKHFESVDREG